MAMAPEITIITPVWNGLPFIRECVESVLAQDFKNWQMVIGDNGSTDGTREYLDQLNDPRIEVYKHERNKGIFGNLNFLFGQAKAPIAYILCADDYFVPGGLKMAVDSWQTATPNTGILVFNNESVRFGKTMSFFYNRAPREMDPAKAHLIFFLFGNFVGNISNASVKVDFIKSSGWFSENYTTAGDFEMWARLTEKHNLNFVDKQNVFVRRHPGVASNYMTGNGQQYKQLLIIFEKLINGLSKSYDRDELIRYFHVSVCAFHYRRAIKSALFGKFTYMKVMLNAKSSILWPKWMQMFTCFPLGFVESLRERLVVKRADVFLRNVESNLVVDTQVKMV